MNLQTQALLFFLLSLFLVLEGFFLTFRYAREHYPDQFRTFLLWTCIRTAWISLNIFLGIRALQRSVGFFTF